jgi:hypothetical protein
MNYHAPTKQFTIHMGDLERASHDLLWAIKNIRLASNLDPKGYKREGPLENPQFAEIAILKAAKNMGIDLGADREGKLDVSEH